MRKQEREVLRAILRDCRMLEREGELTEFGKGERHLCRLLLAMDNR